LGGCKPAQFRVEQVNELAPGALIPPRKPSIKRATTSALAIYWQPEFLRIVDFIT
jgi:hypothetical protein